jgi:hypothetical protein
MKIRERVLPGLVGGNSMDAFSFREGQGSGNWELGHQE